MLPDPLAPSAVVDAFPDWKVDPAPLGEGGFKSAFLASRTNVTVVLKVLRQPVSEDEGAESLPARFAREILAMNDVDCPRVVKILDEPRITTIGEHERYWYTEPYYPGGPLTDRLAKPWDAGAVVDLVSDLAEGIRGIAEAGLVHRDIKPDNIVFDADSRPVLLDLGIALHTNLSTLTADHAVGPHTPAYAAPEQLALRKDAKLDFRTDLFQLGIVAFETLTGVHPFRPELLGAPERLLRADYDRAALDAVAPPAELRRIVHRLLGERPNQRYRKLDHLTDALGACR